jgi:hypothetical protein
MVGIASPFVNQQKSPEHPVTFKSLSMTLQCPLLSCRDYVKLLEQGEGL